MPRTYHVEHLRGPELDEAVRECPVVYIPFGIIEWHGPHLPLGMDTFACQAVVNRAAETHGGLVWPTCWFHDHYASILPLMRELFNSLYKTGFRVILLRRFTMAPACCPLPAQLRGTCYMTKKSNWLINRQQANICLFFFLTFCMIELLWGYGF